ncbi:Gfo/Idh/MocA family oxidoreductase [Aliivibrio sp. S4TY2]|uniref:Gfo/Idh/MocA family protein n=1 Tax=unclassified Aliivibrio TaxID=2645654 RepID=UPI002378E6D6|nr:MULTISPECIES: Gfo/Idh/MocA family oxidoreductase [unclassified Aliivibrio]MDD9155305.1 Gfo/Idh/MocA family oxidoreductase [Aliivibrio sp. S4TY2]MDD9159143.1 Gfo/Idh/MocA family oxidoreductase [Aliivibrio sp. S4TY1]MDD9163307.1 Gfo/Idh/MocA family oxidoreductase [Aliivibrio sp. S4MY2]MDD9167142.1 Gfo/Idh/MocA family oxidoreductase [Aliivibrio sp. S4MY4]MDD9184384.1 Gfo/Idh/MocA family oxidoreductase [Aliivibrio sp. S4MY3]
MKIGIIGLGDIAQKAYLPIITQLENVQPVFCTRNPEVLKQLAQKYRVDQYCENYQELLTLGVDAVMIHAATRVHFDIASFFLKNGVPTFVDKPLADSAEEVEQLYTIAAKHNQPLYVGFNRRHIPLYNQYLPELANGEVGQLRSLRWEKHRHALPGDLRTFIFDDFIHPLDSINLNAQSTIDDLYITHQMQGNQLARLDVQWQVGETLLHASMDRHFGITTERVSASYENQAFEFGSFVEGKIWHNSTEQKLSLKDWTPMLTSKGFENMIQDWISVVEKGKLATTTVDRNIASHQLAERIYQKILGKYK